jgi:phage terminase small subunit
VKQRGRKSAASMELICIDTRRKPIDCPAGLPREVEEIFEQTVASCAPQHFREADVPLLVSYCTATHLTRRYASSIREDATALKAWTECTKLQISLATKLRLTPSSRLDRKTVGREEPPMKRPWDPR